MFPSNELGTALRALRRNPGYVLTAAATLALTIGASVATLAWRQYLVDPKLEAPDADRLRFAWSVTPEDPRGGWSAAELRSIEASGALRPVAGWRLFSTSFRQSTDTRHAWGHAVSGDYFTLFGARPALGRLLGPGDDRPGAPPVLVLGHRFWHHRLGADPGVVGRDVVLDGRHRYTIVGVAAPRFQGEGLGTALYLPLATAPWLPGAQDAPVASVLGRLPEAGDAEAATRLAAAVASIDAVTPRETPRRAELRPVGEALAWDPEDPTVRGAEVLALAVAVLMVLGIANVATLSLARASARQRETATRAALGAGPARLARSAALESGFVSLLGAAAGLPLAAGLLAVVEGYLIRTTAVGFGDWSDASHLPIDWPLALGHALALAALATLACTLPALLLARAPLLEGLKADGEAPGASGPLRLRGRRLLVVAQAALSTALVVVAALASRSLAHLGAQPLGFETGGRWLATVHAPVAPGADVHAALLDEVRALPGVAAAGLASRGPLSPQPARAEARAGEQRVAVTWSAIDHGYLETLGVPLVAGRGFSQHDTADAPRVAVISRELAGRLVRPGGDRSPHENEQGEPLTAALGLRLRLAEDEPEIEVVGVAADSRQGSLLGAIEPHLYLARGQRPRSRPTLVVRAAAPIGAALARLLHERYPGTALIDVAPLAEQHRRGLADARMHAELAAGVGALGLTLAAVGLFGLLAFSVARRSREFGVRLALGARGADLRRQVLGDATRLLAAGVGAGLALAWPLSQLASSRLAGFPAADPWSFGGAAAVLFATGLAAAWLPARRAASTPPLEVLRRA
jgi:predicted permease